MREPQPPFVSVKFDAVGRPHRFLLPEIDFEPPLRAGEQVVVTRGEHLAYGTVARSVPQLAARRAPAVTSTSRPRPAACLDAGRHGSSEATTSRTQGRPGVRDEKSRSAGWR